MNQWRESWALIPRLPKEAELPSLTNGTASTASIFDRFFSFVPQDKTQRTGLTPAPGFMSKVIQLLKPDDSGMVYDPFAGGGCPAYQRDRSDLVSWEPDQSLPAEAAGTENEVDVICVDPPYSTNFQSPSYSDASLSDFHNALHGVRFEVALAIQVVVNSPAVPLGMPVLRLTREFFDYPFTGRSSPRKPGNAPALKRDIRMTFAGITHQGPVRVGLSHRVAKGDFRLVLPAFLARSFPRVALLLIQKSTRMESDFECSVFPSGSPGYLRYAALCTNPIRKTKGKPSRGFAFWRGGRFPQ